MKILLRFCLCFNLDKSRVHQTAVQKVAIYISLLYWPMLVTKRFYGVMYLAMS